VSLAHRPAVARIAVPAFAEDRAPRVRGGRRRARGSARENPNGPIPALNGPAVRNEPEQREGGTIRHCGAPLEETEMELDRRDSEPVEERTGGPAPAAAVQALEPARERLRR